MSIGGEVFLYNWMIEGEAIEWGKGRDSVQGIRNRRYFRFYEFFLILLF